jgi:single-strand DNA-binding protein
MISLNKTLLIGQVQNDPDFRVTGNNVMVAIFHVITEDDKIGEKEFHRVVAFGETAKCCGDSSFKWSTVFVEGRIRTSEWKDKRGDKKSTIEIVASSIRLLEFSDRDKRKKRALKNDAELECTLATRKIGLK